MHPPDEELIRKARNKDKQAFTELFDRYNGKILGYLYRYIGDYQIAEDLVIETFLNAYSNLDKYEERGLFSSWLYRIATNCAKKEFRKRAHYKEVSLDEPSDEGEGALSPPELIADDRDRPDHNLREAELKASVYNIISKLDKKYKDALLLCDVEGLSYEEAGRILRCGPITVGTRLRRARTILYEILRKRGYEL